MKPSRFDRAFELFDAFNANDPRRDEADDGSMDPRELLYAQRMTDMLGRFEPASSEALRLAVRAQHIGRWAIPRADYPEGRIGYKQWRSRLMQYHAEIAAKILRDVGYDDETIARVRQLIRKQGLTRDDEVQTLEDVVCLVFLEHYFMDFAAKHDEEKIVDIVRKTWAKMSNRGQRAALELDLSPETKRLVARALRE
ncbi:MAG: DUF4202 family protein [Gemmatimonas sp.]|nr:DUF4202 family protein [Gemmatimonas sp.]